MPSRPRQTVDIGLGGQAIGGTNPIPTTASVKSAQVDAFGLPISVSPLALFNATMLVDLNPRLWFSDTTGSFSTRTYQTDESSALLSLGDGGTSADGDRVVAQSRYVPYIPAHGSRLEATFAMNAATANVVQEVGLFDDGDGVCFRQTATGLSVVITTSTSGSPVEDEVLQANWSEDTLDGNGASGATLDETKRQILAIDLQWLAVGKVRIGFDMGEQYGVVWAHVFDHANQDVALPYMRSATLPVRYLIKADGGTVASQVSLRQICASVKVYDGGAITGESIGISNGPTTIAVTTRRALLSVRSTSPYVPAFIEGLSVYSTTDPLYVELVLNGSLGGSPSYAAVSGSHLEVDVAGTTVTGGTVIWCGFVAAASQGVNDRPGAGSADFRTKDWLSRQADGTTYDLLSVVATSINGSSTASSAALNMLEIL